MVRYRIEIWNQTNTERLAVFVDPLQAVRHRRLKGEETLSLAVPLDDPASEYLTQGNVLRLQRLGSAVDFSLWRVADDAQERGENAEGVRSIEAYALWMDFRHGLVRQPQVGGRYLATFGLVGLTPTQLLTDFVLPGYQGTSVSFQLGTVDPAIDLPLSLNFERVSPLAALRMIEEAAADGAGAEAQFRVLPDGSGYFVDLLERVGVAAGGAELRYRKNIRAMRRTADERNIETLLFAYGSGLLSLADARWRIASAVGGVITFDGPSPVFEDDAFVGLWWYVDGKAAYPITASDAGAGTLTVDTTSLPALAGGDIGWIATDALGAPLDHLVSPLGVSEYDIRVGTLVAEDVPDARNLLQNGDFSEWTGGVPDHWSLIGSPVVTESTEPRYVQQGGAVAHVVADADEGLVSGAVAITQDETRPYHGMLAGLTIISGRVRMELRHSNGKVYPIQQQPKNEGVGVYITLSANAHSEPLPAGTAQLAIVAHGGPAEFALDCAMITPQLAADVPAFVSGDGAQVLWQRAALELGKRRRPRLEYQVDIIDLYAIDPDAFVFEEIELGDDVTVRDPIARETQRVVEISEDLLTAEATSVVLAPSVRERVEDPHRPALPSISGGIGTGGGRGPEPSEGPAILHHAPQYDRTLSELFIPVLANARTATIEVQLRRDLSDPWPSVADATISDRSGIFGGFAAGPDEPVYYRLRGLDGAGVPGEWVDGAFNAEEPRIPDPFGAVTAYVDDTGALKFSAHGNADGVSLRWAASKVALPSTPNGTINAREATDVDTGITLADGETGYVAVWWYSEAAAGGIRGERVGAQASRGASVTPDVVEIREYGWQFDGGSFTDRSLDLSIFYDGSVASLWITYGDHTDPSPAPGIGGSYAKNVAGGPAVIVETVKESDGATVQLWPFGQGRPDVNVTVMAYDGPNATGNLLGSHTILARQDEGVQQVPRGGTGKNALAAGALVRGAGTDPVEELTGTSTGQVPRWDGSKFVADAPQWNDIASKPSTFPPSTHTHTNLDASNAFNTGILPVGRGGTGRNAFGDKEIIVGAGSNNALNTIASPPPGTQLLQHSAGGFGWVPAGDLSDISTKSIFDLSDVVQTVAIDEDHLLVSESNGSGGYRFGTRNASSYIASLGFLMSVPAHSHTISQVTGLQTALDGKAAVSHTHTISQVTGLQAALDGKANTNHSHTNLNATNAFSSGAVPVNRGGTGTTGFDLRHILIGSGAGNPLGTISPPGAGTYILQHTGGGYGWVEKSTLTDVSQYSVFDLGDVVQGQPMGVGSILVGESAGGGAFRFGTQNAESYMLTLGFVQSGHTHSISQVTGLQAALDGKAAASHSHSISQVTGLQAALDGKAAATHTHSISQVTGLQAALDAKANLSGATFTGDVTMTGMLYLSSQQIYGGFGAESASGEIDWNGATNARSGNGFTLLTGTAANGPGGGAAGYYHPFSFEYSSKNGSGNLTQFAIPYAANADSVDSTVWIRGRYSGNWRPWRAIAMRDWADGRFVALAGSYSNPSWLTALAASKLLPGVLGAGDYSLQATRRLYFDGGGDTYWQEVSANQLRAVVGGSERVRITSSGVQVSALNSLGAVTAAGSVTAAGFFDTTVT